MKITAKGAQALALLDSFSAGGDVKETAIMAAHQKNLTDQLAHLEAAIECDKKLSPVIAWALAITAAIVLSLSWYLG